MSKDELTWLILLVGTLVIFVTYFLVIYVDKRKKKDTLAKYLLDAELLGALAGGTVIGGGVGAVIGLLVGRLVKWLIKAGWPGETETLNQQLNQRNEALKTELADANDQIDHLNQQLNQRNEALQSQLAVANDRIDHWRQKATQTGTLNQRLSRKNEALRNELSDATDWIDTLREKILSFPAVTPARQEQLRRMYYRDEYLQTPEWKQRARIMKEWFGFRCQGCNCSNSERQLEVHHRTYERRGNENPKDLTVLCWKCHEQMENNRIERSNE